MLTAKEYEKLLEFQSRIYCFEDDVRHTILQTMQDLYKDYPMAFFLTDDNEQYINPVSINISDETMSSYKRYYYKTDIFHTSNIAKNLLGKNIIKITDIMSVDDFERTEFYNDTLRKMGVYDEISLQLHNQNRLIGVIGIMKPKGYGDFTEAEIQCAEFVRRSVSACLNEYLGITKIRTESSLILNFAKEAPIGMIIYDTNLKAIQYNQTAIQFACDIWGSDGSNHFNDGLLKKLSEKLYFTGIHSGNSLQTTIQNYSFKIVPFAVPDCKLGFSTFYTVYILKLNNISTIDFDKLKTIYDLTNRECEIIHMISMGYSNKKIADELYLSPHTIKTHIQNIFRKMNSKSRTEVLHKIMPDK
ncbi:MAG: response regulator transcription factor [Clostridia bacterium]|nr:response regulator transcription factor [Clostridia bacterium]